jgi:hypothetical protein
MCLSSVVQAYTQPHALIEGAWKELVGRDAAPRFVNFGGFVPLDKWLRAEEIHPPQDIEAGDGKKYEAGFHVYTEEALRGRARARRRRVYVRRVTCVGRQDGDDAMVAQELYVPSDPEAWPPMTASDPAPVPPAPPAPKKKLLDRILRAGGAS